MQLDTKNKVFGLTYAQALGAVAALLGLIGMFLPWISWSQFGISFSSGGGGSSLLTGFLSIVALGIIFFSRIQAMLTQSASGSSPGGNATTNQLSSIGALLRTWSNIILLIIGLIILLVAANALGWFGAGIGVWITLIAGLGIIASVALNLVLYKAPLLPSNAVGQITQAFNPTPQAPQQVPPAYPPQPAPPAPQQPVQPMNQPQPAPATAAAPKFCPYCAAPLSGETFCPNCGNKVK